jgi:hypothetical protein
METDSATLEPKEFLSEVPCRFRRRYSIPAGNIDKRVNYARIMRLSLLMYESANRYLFDFIRDFARSLGVTARCTVTRDLNKLITGKLVAMTRCVIEYLWRKCTTQYYRRNCGY